MKYFLFVICITWGSALFGQIVLEKPAYEKLTNRYPTKQIGSVLLDCDADFFEKGVKINSVEDIYELRVKANEAGQINLYFKESKIPAGTLIEISSIEKEVYQTFKSENLNANLTTVPVIGEVVIIRYFGPKEGAKLNLSQVGWFPRNYRTTRSSGFCNVDINCSEGADWQDEKRGVVRLLLKSDGFTVFCSGSLINNTARDCKPYLFSSEHCLDGVNEEGLNQAIVYFNYEATNCNSSDGVAVQTVQGLVLKAAGSSDVNSDFALFEIKEKIPLEFSPFFNGWNISGAPSLNGVAIHHPSGDEKKVSTYTTVTQNADVDLLADDFYWEVFWEDTENGHGVTESGSSGAPLFNSEQLIIGNLTGGTSYCTKPNDPDYFGKFSKGWASELDSTSRLDVWLDPIGTGELFVPGSYFPCSDSILQYLPIDSIAVLGNPVRNELNIYLEQTSSSQPEVTIYSINGALVFKERFEKNNITKIKIPVHNLRDGAYFVMIKVGVNEYIEKIIILN